MSGIINNGAHSLAGMGSEILICKRQIAHAEEQGEYQRAARFRAQLSNLKDQMEKARQPKK